MKSGRPSGLLPGEGQATIETAVAIVCALVLIFGILGVFTWLNGSLVTQQVKYEDRRDEAGSSYAYEPPPQIERLNIFGETR